MKAPDKTRKTRTRGRKGRAMIPFAATPKLRLVPFTSQDARHFASKKPKKRRCPSARVEIECRLMMIGQTPRWLRFLERYLSWIAVPNIAVLFVTLQALGFLLVMTDPVWVGRLALVPELVPNEPWRLITFLALPLSLSPIWVIFALWFVYFILNAIESEWGSFRTTLYVLVSILLTIAASFALDFPVTQVSDFESTLFLAAATLFPEVEIRLFSPSPSR